MKGPHSRRPPVSSATQRALERRIVQLEQKMRGLRSAPRAWGAAVSSIMLLPGLVGFWPGSGVGPAGFTAHGVLDHSGNGLHLGRNGSGRVGDVSESPLVPAMFFNGTNAYFSHADTAVLDITGTETGVKADYRGLTLGGWFWFDSTSTQSMMAKYGSSGNFGYMIEAGGGFQRLFISSDGTATTTVGASQNPATSQWVFYVGRFTPSTETKLWINSDTYTDTTSIPASINNNNQPFHIGARSDGANFLDGLAALCFLCAAAAPDAVIMNLFEQTRALFGA